jgi:hypothetical protein
MIIALGQIAFVVILIAIIYVNLTNYGGKDEK